MKTKLLIYLLTAISFGVFSQSVPSYVPTTNLQAWYPFSGNANDVSGHEHNGITDSVYLTTDRCGNPNSAYYFNGRNSYITIPDTFFNNGWTSYTVAFWFNSDSLSNPMGANLDQAMINTSPHNGMEITFNWGGVTDKYDFYSGSNPDGGAWNIFDNGTAPSEIRVTSHVWNHMAMVKDSLAYSMYINGVLDTTFHTSVVALNYNCSLVLGNISEYLDEAFWGKLDDYGIWNRALSPAEVLQLYDGSCTAGITDVEAENGFSVYPNPASDVITIKVNNQALIGSVYSLTDPTGRVVVEGVLTSPSQAIDIEKLSPSVYILQVGNVNRQTFRIVKN